MTKDKKCSGKCSGDKGSKSSTCSNESGKIEGIDLKDMLQRTQANLENYRKQTEKRMSEMRQMAAKDVILQILPIIDNFELALKSADTNQNPKDFLKGVELIYAQLNGLLENNHVSPIITEGKEFDPYFHEALMKVDSDLPENAIVEEFQRGFMLGDNVLRHARVKLSAGKNDVSKRSGNESKTENKLEK